MTLHLYTNDSKVTFRPLARTCRCKSAYFKKYRENSPLKQSRPHARTSRQKYVHLGFAQIPSKAPISCNAPLTSLAIHKRVPLMYQQEGHPGNGVMPFLSAALCPTCAFHTSPSPAESIETPLLPRYFPRSPYRMPAQRSLALIKSRHGPVNALSKNPLQHANACPHNFGSRQCTPPRKAESQRDK